MNDSNKLKKSFMKIYFNIHISQNYAVTQLIILQQTLILKFIFYENELHG